MAKIEAGTHCPYPLEPRGLFRVEQRRAGEGLYHPPGPWSVVAAYATLAEAEEHKAEDWCEVRIVPDASEVERLREENLALRARINGLEDEVAEYSPTREYIAKARARVAEYLVDWLERG